MNDILYELRLNDLFKMITDFLSALPRRVYLDKESNHMTQVLINRIEQFQKKEGTGEMSSQVTTSSPVFSQDEIEMITALLFPSLKPAKEAVEEKQKAFEKAEKALKEAQYEVERIQTTIEKLDKMQGGYG